MTLDPLLRSRLQLAEVEGRRDTAAPSPLALFGLPDQAAEHNDHATGLPCPDSLIPTHSLHGEIKGPKNFPADQRPPVWVVFWAFRTHGRHRARPGPAPLRGRRTGRPRGVRSALVDEFSRLSAGNRIRSGSVAEQPVQDARLLDFQDRLQALAPQTDGQRAARDRAVQLAEGIAATRVLLTRDLAGSIPSPFLLVLGFWLAAMFAGVGPFARADATVVAALPAGAIPAAGAALLILELDRPLDGLMRLSTGPLRHAIEAVGR